MSIILYSDAEDGKCVTDKIVNRNKSLFVIESAFAQGMFILSTGAFLSAFALSLGASYFAIGLLGALVPLGQVFQLPATMFVEAYIQKRKYIAITSFWISRSALLLSGVVPIILPDKWIFPTFFLLYFIYVTAGNIGGCAFGTWFRDSFTPTVFSQVLTNRFMYATLLGAVVSFACAFAIEEIKQEHAELLLYSYSTVFILAGSLGLISALAMMFIKENPFSYKNIKASVWSLRILLNPIKDNAYRGLVLFVAIWCVLNNFVGPFLPIFLMRRLGYSLLTVIILTVVNQFANAVTFPIWSRIANRYGTRVVLFICIPLFYLSIFLWFPLTLVQDEQFRWFGILCLNFLIGVFSAGVNLCLTELIFALSPEGRSTPYLAFNSSVAGIVSAIAPILGGLIASYPSITTLSLSLGKATSPQSIPHLITGLDLVIIITGVIGVASVWTIPIWIPRHTKESRNT